MSEKPVAVGCNGIYCPECETSKNLTTTGVNVKRQYRGKHTCEIEFRCDSHTIEREFRVDADRLDDLLENDVHLISKDQEGPKGGIETFQIFAVG